MHDNETSILKSSFIKICCQSETAETERMLLSERMWSKSWTGVASLRCCYKSRSLVSIQGNRTRHLVGLIFFGLAKPRQNDDGP